MAYLYYFAALSLIGHTLASSCSELLQNSFPNATLWTAEDKPAGSNFTCDPTHETCTSAFENLPAHCRVSGIVNTSETSYAGFELWLPPVDKWNGRYLTVGGGGWAGYITYSEVIWGLNKGFPTMGTDNGHNSSAYDSSWATDAEKLIDFGYRALHETTVAAKLITTAYYSTAPSWSYYSGCSTGGRQGLVSAQMYPEDFDGILAGDAVNDQAALEAWEIWIGALQYPTTLSTYLSTEDWTLVHEEILRQCDSLDGFIDGVVSDPQRCAFLPDTLLCNGTKTATCLTRDQISNVKRAYHPWYDVNDTLVYDGLAPGSELMGAVSIYLNAEAQGGLASDISYASVVQARQVAPGGSDGTNPDLRGVLEAGGKIIQYHGQQDSVVPPTSAPRYYESVRENMTDVGTPVSDFYRLFMVPGMGHCTSGDGAWVIDSVSQALEPPTNATERSIFWSLVEWVEGGAAPEYIIGAAYINATQELGLDYSRPICLWPDIPVYLGGDSSEASSWACPDSKIR